MSLFQEKMDLYCKTVEDALDKAYPDADEPQGTIFKASRYSLLAGGKRIRPVLCLATGALFHVPQEDLIPFACAIEMIHTFSLIHDDLPSMDNDDYRRGRLTSHKVFGEGMAVLAGDALINKAYETMLKACIDRPAQGKTKAAYAVSKATGDYGMIGGQVVDLESEHKKISYDLLKKMHLMKTGALIKAPVLAACLIGNAGERETALLADYAEQTGLAFQIKDDILDVISDSESMGKTTGKDLKSEKSTYITLFGLEQSQILLQETTGKAYQALEQLKAMNYDTGFLFDLTDYLLVRKN